MTQSEAFALLHQYAEWSETAVQHGEFDVLSPADLVGRFLQWRSSVAWPKIGLDPTLRSLSDQLRCGCCNTTFLRGDCATSRDRTHLHCPNCSECLLGEAP